MFSSKIDANNISALRFLMRGCDATILGSTVT